MGIVVGKDTKVLVQGITGREGNFHATKMKEYGTNVVGGVTPGKGGQIANGFPVFNTVKDAVEKTGANASVIFVPARFACDAIMEAMDSRIRVVACITEGLPVHDMLKVKSVAEKTGTVLIGPNCPGIITVGVTKLGIMPGRIFKKGPLGLISRSGTLTYEVVDELSRAGLGQTTCIGIGGDPILGTSFTDLLKLFEEDDETEAVILIGEIGGSMEEEAAEFIKTSKKPVVSFIAGKTAPPGKRMGHAGAIVSGSSGTAKGKVKAFNEAGVPVADTVPEIVEIAAKILKIARVHA
ncbi:MAG: succinate--CoA ligase subunit alpha [Candidatus Eremiobacteraeota bacterium]|nr:succinate--CoA ligase subunit alpha [Candidatus Eremiobacteraeota bacterium]